MSAYALADQILPLVGWVVGQTGPAGKISPGEIRYVDYVIWFLIVIVLMSGTLILAKKAKSMLGIGEKSKESDATWDLDHLREMRNQGELTIPQYETLKKRLIMEMKAPKTAPKRSAKPSQESANPSDEQAAG